MVAFLLLRHSHHSVGLDVEGIVSGKQRKLKCNSTSEFKAKGTDNWEIHTHENQDDGGCDVPDKHSGEQLAVLHIPVGRKKTNLG